MLNIKEVSNQLKDIQDDINNQKDGMLLGGIPEEEEDDYSKAGKNSPPRQPTYKMLPIDNSL